MSATTTASAKAGRFAAATLAVLFSLFAVVRIYRQDLFAHLPWHGLKVFLLPTLGCCLLSLLKPVRVARLLLCLGVVAIAGRIIGLPGTATVALVLLVALSVGGLLGRLGGITATEGLLPGLLRLTLGIAVLSLALTVLGHFPVASRLSYGLGLVLLATLGWRGIARDARAAWRGLAAPADFLTWLGTGLFSGAALLTLCYSGVFGSTADTLAVHLYVPSYVATYGSWSYDFHSYVWALEPMASDLLFGVVYVLSDPLGAQLLNACGMLLIAGLIYAACRRRLGSFDASLPATAWLCVPYLFFLAGSLHAEVLLSLFLLAAFLHLESLGDAKRAWGDGLINGILIAAALATKVLAVIMGPVLLVYLILVPGRRHGGAWLLRFMAAAAIVVLLAGGVQYAYAFAVTGNPVFYFYNDLFRSPYFPPINFMDSHWTGRYDWDLPFDLTFNTRLFSETGSGSVGLQWFMLVPAASLCLWSKQGAPARWYALAALWFAAVTLASEQYFRYALPALPFLALFIAELGAQPGRLLRSIYRGCLMVAIGLDLVAQQGLLLRWTDLPIDELLRSGDRGAALQEKVPEIAANRLIDSLETRPVNVLYVSHSWGAELRGTAYYQSWYNPDLNRDFRYLRQPAGLQRVLDAYHIDYVVVNPDYKHAIGAGLVQRYCRSHCQLVATLGSVQLYKLASPAPASSP